MYLIHSINKVFSYEAFSKYSQTWVQRPPLGPPKSGHCLKGQRLVHNFVVILAGLGIQAGRCLEVVVNTGLNVLVINILVFLNCMFNSSVFISYSQIYVW